MWTIRRRLKATEYQKYPSGEVVFDVGDVKYHLKEILDRPVVFVRISGTLSRFSVSIFQILSVSLARLFFSND